MVDNSLTPEQARAARALVVVSVDDVADASTFSAAELRNFERGRFDLTPAQNHELRLCLERLGAMFIDEDGEAGRGVRLKYNRRKVRALRRWENEGGPTLEDDV